MDSSSNADQSSNNAVNATPSQPEAKPEMQVTDTTKQPKKRGKWFMPAVVVAVLAIGGGAAAYMGVVQQSPENIWKKAMSTTSEGLDSLIKKSTENTKKGMKASGTFKVESPVAVDGSFDAKGYETDSVVTGNVGFSGLRLNAEFRSKVVEGAKNPDLYFKVSGLDGLDQLASGFGADPSMVAGLAELNDQWFAVDHTLLDQATAGAGGSAAQITPEDAKVISEKLATVIRERLLTSDPTKAVVTVTENVGKEDFEGASTYHFKVKVNKNTTKDFFTALKDALKETKFKDLILAGDSTKSFEEALNFDKMISDLEKANFDDAKADVWVDMKTKFVRNIRITPTDVKEGEAGQFDIGMPYDGGSDLPFVLKITGDDSEMKGAIELKAVVNRDSLNTKYTFNADLANKKDATQNVKASGEATVELNDDKVNIDKPDGSKSIMELLGGFMGGSGLDQQTLPSGYPDGFDPSQLDNLESL